MVLFCGTKHPLFKMAESHINVGVLAKYPCVDVVARQSSRAAKVMDRMHIHARAGTVNSRLLFVLSGNFLGFLPLEFARDLVADGDLRPLLPEEVSYQTTCYAIVRRDAPPNAARDRFLAELKRVFAPKQGMLAIAAAKEVAERSQGRAGVVARSGSRRTPRGGLRR